MDNITILLLRVESQWAIKTESSKEYSHLELIGVQHECDNISMMSIVMLSLPGSHHNLCVSYFGYAVVWQKYFLFQFIVTIIFILVVLCSDMLLCLS